MPIPCPWEAHKMDVVHVVAIDFMIVIKIYAFAIV